MAFKTVGISIKGLPTTAPYCRGSLMLNTEGTSVALPRSRYFFDLALSICRARGSVAPCPPM